MEYEKYCSPLLHLSGIQVSVVLTNNETEIRTLMGSIPLDVDALIIAGGNGTISEVLLIFHLIYTEILISTLNRY